MHMVAITHAVEEMHGRSSLILVGAADIRSRQQPRVYIYIRVPV